MKQIVFTKVNTAELLEREISDPGEKEVQVALAVSTMRLTPFPTFLWIGKPLTVAAW